MGRVGLATTGVLLLLNVPLDAQIRPKEPLTNKSGVIMLDGPSFMGDLGAERVPGVVVGGAGSLCLADTGWVGEARLQKLREVATTSDSDGVHLRGVLGRLSRVDSAQVALVADSSLCRRASDWFGKLRLTGAEVGGRVSLQGKQSVVPLTEHGLSSTPLRGRAGRRQLKLDPLGRHSPGLLRSV